MMIEARTRALAGSEFGPGSVMKLGGNWCSLWVLDVVCSSDITFENVPSSYAMLKIHTLPATGGDTLWASAYEAYDRLSQPMRAFLETLTATHDANFFHDEARRLGIPIKSKGRGHPSNEGEDLRAVHPVVRTNRESSMPVPTVSEEVTTNADVMSCFAMQLSPAGRDCLSTMPLPSASTASRGMRMSAWAGLAQARLRLFR